MVCQIDFVFVCLINEDQGKRRKHFMTEFELFLFYSKEERKGTVMQII